MATGGIVVTIIPILLTHHRTPVPPVVTVKHPPLQGKTQYGTHSNPICSGPGGKHQMHLHQVWHPNLLQRQQDPQSDAGKAKGSGPRKRRCGVIYSYQCGAIDCGEEYISETSRTLWERYKEHLREPSPIQAHSQLIGHQLSPDNFNIIGREGQDLTRLIKDSIHIRVNNPTLNRNIGKFQLNHIWDRVLFSTPNLKVAIPIGNVQHSS